MAGIVKAPGIIQNSQNNLPTNETPQWELVWSGSSSSVVVSQFGAGWYRVKSENYLRSCILFIEPNLHSVTSAFIEQTGAHFHYVEYSKVTKRILWNRVVNNTLSSGSLISEIEFMPAT